MYRTRTRAAAASAVAPNADEPAPFATAGQSSASTAGIQPSVRPMRGRVVPSASTATGK